MKKITAILLVIIMLVSMVACNNNSQDSNSQDNNDTISDLPTTEVTSENVSDTVCETEGETTLTEEEKQIFRVGYSRKNISPKEDIYLSEGSFMTEVIDPLYATCIAVYDGETTVLIYTADVKNIDATQSKNLRMKISLATGVPEGNIMISSTHNHSAPTPGVPSNDMVNKIWTLNIVHKEMINAGKEAIADLDDAEMYVGTAKTTGMAFVRRYLLADGTYSGIHNGNKSTAPVVAYESEADDTMQIVRFVREEKKDIVIANWQAHVAHAIGKYPHSITADLVGFARKYAEMSDDILFALYIGASGNINLTAKVPGTKKYNSHIEVGRALGLLVRESLDSLKKIETGKIKVSYKDCEVKILKDDAETVRKAKEVREYEEGSNEYKAMLDKYGFASKYEVNAIVGRNNAGETGSFYIAAIGFGDLSFVSVPYEMFDTNGMQVKEGSPFEMTFVLTNAGGSFAYIPSAEAVPHGGYEVYKTSYAYGTAEQIVGELLSMLDEFKK